MGGVKDMTGQRFGMLVVVCRAENTQSGRATWRCRCDCGKEVVVRGGNLRSGGTKSCGCYKVACLNRSKTTHHGSNTRLYRIWSNMKDRCYRPANDRYRDYGGRGIGVCEAWRASFEAFRDWAVSSGYRDNLTIDRKDNDLGYSPENCRWTNRAAQNNNTRRNRYVTYGDETHTVSEWARMRGLTETALRLRLNRGWPLEAALTTPLREK